MTRRRPDLSVPADEAAPLLLGSLLTSRVGDREVSIRITEVEAYGGVGEDPGSHAYRRMTARNATMFGPPGRAYVYFTYGMHFCVNIVTRPEGLAGAVLVRAGEVVDGIETARQRRPSATRDRDLARGPARLTAALGITGALDGVDLFAADSILRLTMSARPPVAYEVGPRTGVAGAGAQTPWRFHLPGEPSVSPYRRAQSRPRVTP